MPDVTVPSGQTGSGTITLAPNAVSTVTFTDNIGSVEVMWDGAADVWYTVNGTVPALNGTNGFRLPAGIAGSDMRDTVNTAVGTDVVRFLSASACVVSVQRVA